MVRADSRAGRVVALLSRRAPAFQPLPGDSGSLAERYYRARRQRQARRREIHAAASNERFPGEAPGPTTQVTPVVLPSRPLWASRNISVGTALAIVGIIGTLIIGLESATHNGGATAPGHVISTNTVALSQDGKLVVSVNSSGVGVLSDAADPAHPVVITTLASFADSSGPSKFTFDPSGKTLAALYDDGVVAFWDVTDPAHPVVQATLPTSAVDGSITAITFDPNGKTLAVLYDDGVVALWDVTDPAHPVVQATLDDKGALDTPTPVSFSPDGETLALIDEAGNVVLWDAANLAHPVADSTLRDASSHGGADTSVFSPDGRILAAVYNDGSVELWDVANPAHPMADSTLGGDRSIGYPAGAVAFRPDGHILAIADTVQSVVGPAAPVALWNVTDPAHPAQAGILAESADQGDITGTAFSPDGRVLAGVFKDGEAFLWDVADPAHPVRTAVLLGPSDLDKVQAVIFSRDGKAVVAAHASGRLDFWDVASAQLLGTFSP